VGWERDEAKPAAEKDIWDHQNEAMALWKAEAMRQAIKGLSSKQVYHGPITVRVDQVQLPTGEQRDYTVVEYRPSVAIVPLFPDGRVLLIRQYRYVLQDWSLEVPGGMVAAGEDPPTTARRELAEEGGYHPGQLEFLVRMQPDVSMSTQVVTIYVATNLTKTQPHREPSEVLEVVMLDLAEALERISRGEITSAPTIIGLQAVALARRTGRG
jgi:ADP-ribose pyrophosphatase